MRFDGNDKTEMILGEELVTLYCKKRRCERTNRFGVKITE